MEQVIEFAGKHLLMVGGFVAVLGFLVWTEVMRKVQGLNELTPAEAVPWINHPEAVIIDISSPAEFNQGHIVNARNLQASRLSDPDDEVKKLKDSKLLVVCNSGQSAIAAAGSLRKMGANEVAVLKGGMSQWRSDQFPVTTKK
jgi:rhodanese-related sulfurtransferase